MTAHQNDVIIDTILALVDEIARTSLECATKALKIGELVAELSVQDVDRCAVQDAIEMEMADADLSDVRLASTTDAVLKAARER